MRVLWDKSPQPAYDIIQQLAKTENWSNSTVKTLLTRLHRKKALGTRRYKNLFLYFPLVTEESLLQGESQSFLERFFEGSVQTFMLHFVKREKLTSQDLEELRKILEKAKKL